MTEGFEVTSEIGAVAAGPPEAARVGAGILSAGGNAFDAAAATSLACCVLQPASTGVGGYGGSGLVLEGKTGKVWSVDFNSMAPAAAREDMFELERLPERGEGLNEREYFCKVKDNANVHGPLAVGVPGMMAGMGVLWERWGALKWPEIVAPSLKLIEDGFPYSVTAGQIKGLEEAIRRFEPTRKHLMPSGELPGADDIWHPRDLGKTLSHLAEAGWRDLYEGEIGRRIADYIQSIGGILSRADMAEYEPRVTAPYTTTYRGVPVHGVILPNGNLTVLQMVNMLECFPPMSEESVEYWHRLAEVFKLAWRDRLRYLADPDFVEVPIERLLSKDYAAGLVETIRQFPEHVDKRRPMMPGDPDRDTLHVATADREGNLVTVTITQGMGFGSCVTVPNSGIILGHGMCRLDPRPGFANSIAPRKRVLNNCGATLMQFAEREVGAGLPGGRRIVSVGAQLVQRFVDLNASSHEASVAPRLHVEICEPVEITESAGEDVVAGLRELGHEVEVRAVAGAAHCAEVLKARRQVRAGGGTWAACPDGDER